MIIKCADLISLTKVYALLYSTYVETSFLKLIHTPKAFIESEIMQITQNTFSRLLSNNIRTQRLY